MGGRSAVLDFGLWPTLAAAFCATAAAWLSPLHHLFDLVAMFAGPAFWSCALFALAAGLLRRPAKALGFGVCALFLLIHLGPQWMPKHPRAAQNARPVTVYFANVWARNRDNAAIARSVARADADVVALTEITDHHAAALPEILKAYPYRSSTAPARYFQGGPRTVIASRWPIERSTVEVRDGLAAGEVIVQAPDGPIRVLAVHLTRPWPLDGRVRAQRDQTRRLAERVRAGGDGRVLVVGDFNATAASAILRRFAKEAGVRPAPARMGTWFDPLPGPFAIAIDNGFVGDGLTVLDRKVGPANGSDHRPIVVTVARTK